MPAQAVLLGPGSRRAAETAAWLRACLHAPPTFVIFISRYTSTVWGVEPVVTHQTPWLESTGVLSMKDLSMKLPSM